MPMKNKNQKIKKRRAMDAPLSKDIRAITQRILSFANRGLPRVEFLNEVFKIILEYFGSEAIDLKFKESDKFYICKGFKDNEKSFRMEISRFSLNGNSYEELLREKGSEELSLGGRYKSSVLVNLVFGDEKIGTIEIKCLKKNRFKENDVEAFEGVVQTLVIALAYRRAQVALRERVKELTCLYGVAKNAARPEVSLDELVRDTVELLPPAWLYPNVTSARITLDGREYKTRNFKGQGDRLASDVVVNGHKRGIIEVVYIAKKPEVDEGPFMKEERSLIDTLARELAIIIERRQAEEDKSKLKSQIMHADRLATIGQLAAGVAHELNEPLGNILGFAQLAIKSEGISGQVKGDIEKIVGASLHAREVIKKLLVFARQTPASKIKIGLNRVVEEGLYFFEARCAKLGIDLARELYPELPEIYADPSQLNQVLVNLVVNAIQAMPDGGRLLVKTDVGEGKVSLIVEDSGIGMSEKILKQIFVPFFTTKDVDQGTGLGLAVVHGIVTSHGGIIKVESVEGKGSRFEIQLPIDSKEEKENYKDAN